jgi:hypothetical protein
MTQREVRSLRLRPGGARRQAPSGPLLRALGAGGTGPASPWTDARLSVSVSVSGASPFHGKSACQAMSGDICETEKQGIGAATTGGERATWPVSPFRKYPGRVATGDGGRAPTLREQRIRPARHQPNRAPPHRVSGATAVVAQAGGRATPQGPPQRRAAKNALSRSAHSVSAIPP